MLYILKVDVEIVYIEKIQQGVVEKVILARCFE